MYTQEVKNRQSLWSFNHRTRAHIAFDSSSDSESEPDTNVHTNIPSDDTRLIQELDISSRHETVEYKPNPWSIARINAASRGSNKEPRGQATSEDTRQKSHSQAPQGRIVDAFRIQAERKPPRVHAPLKAFKVVKPRSDTPKSLRVSREDQVYTQGGGGSKQGEHSQHDGAHLRASVSPIRPPHAPAVLLSSAPQEDLHDLRFQPHPCVPTLSCTPDSKRGDIQMSEEPTLQRNIAHISTSESDMTGFTQSRCNGLFLSLSSPPTSRDFPVDVSYLRPEGYQSSPPRPSHRNVYITPSLLPRASVHPPFSQLRHGVRMTGNREFSGVLA